MRRALASTDVVATLHLCQIRKDWNQFYRQHAKPTRRDLIDKKAEIDAKCGRQFLSPRHLRLH
jgi:hypothetical protein